MVSSLLLYCLTVWCEFSRRCLLSMIYEDYLYSVDLCLQSFLETFWVRLSEAQNEKRVLAIEKILNKSMLITICYLVKGSASDREVAPFCSKKSWHLESKVDNFKVKVCQVKYNGTNCHLKRC